MAKHASDIHSWCRACEVCASRQVQKPIKPYLTPIPVGGAFDRIGVDIIKFPCTRTGMTYAVVFVDYLTKWPEVFATADQTSPIIARLLVEEVINSSWSPIRTTFGPWSIVPLEVDGRYVQIDGYYKDQHHCVPFSNGRIGGTLPPDLDRYVS